MGKSYNNNESLKNKQTKRQKQHVLCYCGCILLYSSFWPHFKNKKHKNLIICNNIIEPERVIIKTLIMPPNSNISKKIKDDKPIKKPKKIIPIITKRPIQNIPKCLTLNFD